MPLDTARAVGCHLIGGVMPKKRIVVVANKWWECDPMMNVLLHDKARDGKTLGWPEPLRHPRRRPESPLPEDKSPKPRAVFHLPNIDAEIWCISDLLEHLPDKPEFQSSSEVKMQYMSRIFAAQADAPALVVAFGTAGYPDNTTQNGSVVVGSNVFMYDAHPNDENPDSKWRGGPFETVIKSSIGAELFNALTVIETSPEPTVLGRFIVEPLNPAPATMLLARHDYVAVGSVNVTDYREYSKTTDAASLKAFGVKNNVSLARSLETTHGLIRTLSGDAPFIFVSGITDRVGHFPEEVDLRAYAQNFVAAHNAGIVIAWMLVRGAALLA
jgi:hypothetical protein